MVFLAVDTVSFLVYVFSTFLWLTSSMYTSPIKLKEGQNFELTELFEVTEPFEQSSNQS